MFGHLIKFWLISVSIMVYTNISKGLKIFKTDLNWSFVEQS